MAKKVKVDLVEIKEHGQELILPDGLDLDGAIEVLQREKRQRNEVVDISATIDGYLVPDAAWAFSKALSNIYGFSHQTAGMGWWPTPPRLITVKTGVRTSVQVPWGGMVVPGLDGQLQVDTHLDANGRYVMVIFASVKRKHKGQVDRIVEETKRVLAAESIYKGKAFNIRLLHDDGRTPIEMPEPQFITLNPSLEQELIFSRGVQAAIETNIFTILEHTDRVRELGVPLRRGVLLAGKYGTGKTMTSTVVATKAVANGFTFIKCERANELAHVLKLARDYGRAVVFCEDIDRVVDGQRTMSMDELLNVVDGIESKATELVVVFTTNDATRINKAMLRPGRLDAVIEVLPPDAEAVQRLFFMYGRGTVLPDTDVSAAAAKMQGEIAATVREVVERAKLAALRHTANDEPVVVTGQDLLDSALAMQNQLELLREQEPDNRTDEEKAADRIAAGLRDAAHITIGNGPNGKVAEPVKA